MRPTSGEAPHRCARYLRLVGIGINVRSWHKADVRLALTNVCFEGKNGHDADSTRCPLMTQNGPTDFRRNAALRLTLTLFDVLPAAESVWAESTPAYGRFGAGNLEAARAVSVPGALTSKWCISARDDKEIQANDVR